MSTLSSVEEEKGAQATPALLNNKANEENEDE